MPTAFQQLRGQGEVWVDADGYPQRQIIDILMPETSEQFDTQSHMVVNFHFDSAVSGVPLVKSENLSAAEAVENNAPVTEANTTSSLVTAPVDVSLPSLLAGIFVIVIASIFAVFTARSNRLVRKTIPIGIALLMIITPILRPISQAHAQENDTTQALPTISEALGMSETAGDEDVNATQMQPNTPLIEQGLVEEATCGTADVNDDTDLDGLNDFVEICLGTDPYSFDTDEDGITDTIEVNGFVFTNTLGITTTFYSNPHESDSNFDGLDDFREMAAPLGIAPDIDPDGDDIPNIWDDDNDGDGVLDADDLDPFTVTSYQSDFSLQTGLNGSSYNGFQYIEFQVQPQDQSHLRLALTELDWPYDDVGTLQAHDVSKMDELSFSPVLKVTTNQTPYEDTFGAYGISAVGNPSTYDSYNNTYDEYEMTINLYPVVDGGRITAFGGRIAYNPEHLRDIDWSKIQFGWVAYMENSYTSSDNQSQTSMVPVAEYTESAFRFTGLKITKSGATKFGVVGTPGYQTNHRPLVNLLMGMNGTYLGAASPDFDEIISRFTTPTTPLSQTWGVPAADIAVGLPALEARHMDDLLGKYSNSKEVIDDFLADNNYSTNEMASLITIVESKTGSGSLDTLDPISGNQITFNLANIPVSTIRTIDLANYVYKDNRWIAPDDTDAMNTILATYENDPGTVLADLQTTYPDLTQSDLIVFLSGFYALWMSGQMAIIETDGLVLVDETADDAVLAQELNLPSETDTVTYLIEVNRWAIPGAGSVFSLPQTYYNYRNSGESLKWIVTGITLYSIYYIYTIYRAISVYRTTGLSIRSYTYKVASWSKMIKSINSKALTVARWANRIGWERLSRTSYKVIRHLGHAESAVRFGRLITKIGYVVSAIALGVSIAFIWITYKNFHSPYQFDRDYALAYAIVDTILTTILTIFAFTGIGFALVLFLTVLDLIVYAITAALGFPIDSIVTTSITKLFADIRAYAKIYSVDMEGLSLNNEYLVAGGTLTLSDVMDGWLVADHNNDPNKLAEADIQGYFRAKAGTGITTDTDSYDKSCEPWTNPNGLYFRNCTNTLSADYTFANAGRDQKIEFMYTFRAEVPYVHYALGGIIAKDKTDIVDLPDELEDEDKWHFADFYIDVLPNTLTGLLNWSELSNNDLDGDDVDNTTETALNNIPPTYSTDIDGDGLENDLDWDRDGDGLSDGFEVSTQNTTGSDVNIKDTDGDGLNDGIEYHLGTSISVADQDSDGLSDGQEQFHWDGSAWSGGGWFVNINGVNYWTFSPSTNPDFDGDGVSDASEKANGTSPYGYNDAPRLEMTAGPLFENEDGISAIYASSGSTVTATLSLLNTSAQPVTTTLSLCLPPSLTNVNVVAGGDRVPTTQVTGDCFDWDFSGNNLLGFQQFNVDMTALAGGGTLTGTITADLPFAVNGTPHPLSNQILYVEDNTVPTIQITNPLTDTILTSQYYVVGGFTQDADSWVDHVQVTVPGGTYSATLSDSQWGYTWNLPADGLVTVSAVAYDLAGNASDPTAVQVLVDTVGPIMTINVADGDTVSAGESYTTTIPLSGTVTDNFAGIARIQLRYNEGPWRTIWDDDANPLAANWNGLWELPTTENAQGEHSLYLRAYDAFGNTSYLTRTIFIDVLPPTNDLTNRAFVQEIPKHVPGSQPVPLYGVASDAGNNPLPADPADLSGSLNSISDATVWLQVDSLNDNDGGVYVTWLGDNNGDRLGDLAVGMPAANGGTGKVVVVNGRPGDWPIPNIGDLEFLLANTPSYVGESGAGIGSIIHSAGDVNGDGVADMLIGDPANDRLILVLGNPTAGQFEQPLDGSYPRQIEIVTTNSGELLSGQTAVHAAGIGDVNVDGFDDLLVSVTGVTTGAVYVVSGDRALISPIKINNLGAAVLPTGPGGASVAGVGDVNDDFIPDFAVAMGGTVYLFAGGSGWAQSGLTPLTTADAIATFATADSLPTIVGAGDLNGDNIDDFAFTNGNTPVVVFGNASESFSTQTLGGFASPLSGFLAAVGDVDKDGRTDLLVGNADEDAYLFSGADLTTAAATIEGVAAAASTPFTAGADLAGDGSSDLALVPTADVATNLGYDGFVPQPVQPPFINRNDLPEVAGSSTVAVQQQPQSFAPESGEFMAGDVTVAAVGGDFTSIQAAIDSGADRVLIQPGVYAEVITLTNAVTVIGSGADRTVLTFPGGSSATTLVNVDGISNAALMNLTLLGKGSGTGFAVSNGATNIALARAVVQGMATAVSVDGSTSTLALKNNTIVGNTAGFLASSNAGVDIRNTIFAYNTGTAVQYGGGAVLQLHQYNLYYANGTDLSPNNPGGGELFSDPLFLNYGKGDFRTEAFSPVIDAGAPGDPVPPGAGKAIDIGHLEQSGSSFFADDDYCAVCLNDGLIWGVDAFATIQEAVDAAQADIDDLQLDTPIQFTVGVNGGVYTESVVISTSVKLVGQVPDQTIIVGNGGPAVTFQSAVNAGVSGFTLIGGGLNPIGVLMNGGSNSVAIDYNLIKNNSTGISVTQRATGYATFNTIISNTNGVQLARGTYFNNYGGGSRLLEDSCNPGAISCEERGYLWLDLSNSIISGNDVGLSAVGKSVLFSDNNLLFNTIDYTNVISGRNDIIGQDPLLTGEYGYLQIGSPALDAATPDAHIPPGGGVRADLGWHELLAAPISIFMGQPDESLATESIGVDQVEYAVVPITDTTSPITSTLPTTWTLATLDSPGEKLTYWQTSYNAASDGYYRVYSRASDVLGNTETGVDDWYDGTFVVDSNAPVVTMTVSTYLVNNWLLLEAEVVDYIGTSFDIEDYYFTIDGERVDGRWAVEQWTADGSSPRTFRYFYQNNTGMDLLNVDIQAFAIDGAGNVGSSAIQTRSIPGEFSNQWIDTIPPRMITITAPIPGTYVEDSILFEGMTWDNGAFFSSVFEETDSRTSGIELSFDGGLTWNPALSWKPQPSDPEFTYADRVWEYEWTVPTGLDATTIPVRVRAIDNAGNFRSEIITVTLDTAPPRDFQPVDFNLAEGIYTDHNETLTGTWGASLDGSGWVTATAVGENQDGTYNLFPLEDYSITAGNNEGGGTDLTFGVIDEAGNFTYDTFGTWYIGDVAADSGAGWAGFQTLNRDGFMDTDHNEWLTATEFIDDDERPDRTQNLWVTWDHLFSFIGWQGASWGPDGTLWVYYDLVAGGNNVAIEDGRHLPFEADFAVSATGEYTAYQWEYDTGSSSWISTTLTTVLTNPGYQAYGHNPDTETTEIRPFFNFLNTGTETDWNRMIAYAVDQGGDTWSAFPTVNDLDGSFDYFYEWNKANGTFYLLNQPETAHKPAVAMSFTSDPPVQDTVSANETITYVADLTSLEDEDEAGIELSLTGSTGLTYQSVAGAASYDCSAGTSCTINLPTISGGGTQVVTITAVLDSDLTSIDQITTTTQAQVDVPLPDTMFSRVHKVDIDAPIVTINPYPANVAGSGLQSVFGSAYDGDGAGVAYVEVSTDGTIWQLADGEQSWTAEITAPGGSTWPLFARATDYHNQTSVPVMVTMIEDIYAPILTATVPSLVGGSGSFHHFDGTTRDPIPPGAKVATMEFQVDSDSATWDEGVIYKGIVNGEQYWSYSWFLPHEDGITHTVRFRATDYAENVTTSGWYTTVVDTIAPAVTVTQQMTQVVTGTVALSGQITDGMGVNGMNVLVYPEFGQGKVIAASVNGSTWTVSLNEPQGHYSLYLIPEDIAGNSDLVGPYPVEVVPFVATPGDVGCDGTRNVLDALYILQYEVGLRTGSNDCPLEENEIYLPSCDVNGDFLCNVVDALYIMQCEVGIANSLCPTAVSTEAQVEGMVREEANATVGEGTARTARVSNIQIESGSVGAGQTTTLSVWVTVPESNNLTAVTLDITFDPNIVAFDDCTTNDTDFTLSLCALQAEDGQTISLTALSVGGSNGQMLLGELAFTGLLQGISNLSLTVRTYEDGSDSLPRLRDGQLRVGRSDGTLETEKEIPLSGKVIKTADSSLQYQSSPQGKAPEAAVPSTITVGSGVAAPGETVTVPITVVVPISNSLTAATLRFQYDPTILTFDSCATNNSDFDFNLCNRSEGDGVPPDVISFSAISAFGVNGTLQLGTITFVGNTEGTSSIVIVPETFQDGSGEAPVVNNGTVDVESPTAVTMGQLSATALSLNQGGTVILILALIMAAFALLLLQYWHRAKKL
ncbi:MAG: cohesin domain-containing protein [Candidatus Promineifilaceae bacterium]